MARLQVRQGKPGHQECRPNIVPDGAVEILDAIIFRRSVGDENSGIADENVERTETSQRECDTCLGVQFLGKVTEVNDRSAAGGRDRFGHVPHRIGGEAAQNEPCAFAGEFVRDCLADPGTGSGDDRNLVLQAHL